MSAPNPAIRSLPSRTPVIERSLLYLGAGSVEERNALKVAVNVLLNARTKKAAIGAIENELPKYGMITNASDLVKHIEEKLVDVKSMLCNNVSTGLWLQNVFPVCYP